VNISVLDHGYVKLIETMGTEETIIEAARMSTGKGFLGWDPHERCKHCQVEWNIDGVGNTLFCVGGAQVHDFKPVAGDQKLLEFLYSNAHMTPFEMCELHIEVFAPILVWREWHRHRTMSYNEFSARYAQMPNMHYLPELSRFQTQSSVNKQSSGGAMGEALAQAWHDELRDEQQEIYDNYDHMVGAGLAKEVARINTPVSRYSRCRVKTDLRNWLGFLNLRMRPNAQWEIRQFANAAAEIIREKWPRTFKLFVEHDLWSMKLSSGEIDELVLAAHEDREISDKLKKKLSTHPKDNDAYKGVKALEGVL
jgi:thymidylate synthase (FAD)